jgi:hypothetical protein
MSSKFERAPKPDTKPDPKPALGASLKGEAAAAESAVRLAFIVAYLKDPTARPEFADKLSVFRLVTEERTYQQFLGHQAQLALDTLPPQAPVAHRQALEASLATSRKRQAMLFDLLKKLTGVQGRTGGTAFEADFGL